MIFKQLQNLLPLAHLSCVPGVLGSGVYSFWQAPIQVEGLSSSNSLHGDVTPALWGC